MSEFSPRVQTYLKKREARNTLPLLMLGIWCGNFLMAVFSRTLSTPEGGIGIGAITSIILAIVLSVFYTWRTSSLAKQLDDLRKSMTKEDREALLREIIG